MPKKQAKSTTNQDSPSDSENYQVLSTPKTKKGPQNSNQRKKKSPRQKNNDDKKKENPNGSHYTKFSQKLYRGSKYMEEFIKEVKGDLTSYKCMKCPDLITGKKGRILVVNGLFGHLETDEHERNTPPNEKAQLKELRILLQTKKAAPDQQTLDNNKTTHFLDFTPPLMSMNLSYSQIEKIGKYLQEKSKKLEFLKTSIFDQHFVSKLSQSCFGPAIRDGLVSKLQEGYYSLIVDNATFGGQSLCALKIKYLEKDFNEGAGEEITTVKSKIIPAPDLKESSSGKTMSEILEEKLFTTEELRNNCIGFAHDNGPPPVGPNIVLVTLLRGGGQVFLDLCGPCHGHHLPMGHAMKEIPKECELFVSSIPHSPQSPQKKALPRGPQISGDLGVLLPKKLALARWPNFGQSLGRIFEIWGPLKKFFDSAVKAKIPKAKRKKRKSAQKLGNNEGDMQEMGGGIQEDKEGGRYMGIKEIANLLGDGGFYLGLNLLSHIVNIINKYNGGFQNQPLGASCPKKYCYESHPPILGLIVGPQFKDLPLGGHLNTDYQDWGAQDTRFLAPKDPTQNITGGIGPKFKDLDPPDDRDKSDFAFEFCDPLGGPLNNLGDYLPLGGDLIAVLDFVGLKEISSSLGGKVGIFAKKFGVLGQEEKNQLQAEYIKFKSVNVEYYRDTSINIPHMWDRLEEGGGLGVLAKLARMAETLPTSSPPIEQSFSNVKLLGTDLRNRLSGASLEGLILIGEEYRESKSVVENFGPSLLEKYEKVLKNYNLSKKKVILPKLKNQNSKVDSTSKKDNSPIMESDQTQNEGKGGTENPSKKKVLVTKSTAEEIEVRTNQIYFTKAFDSGQPLQSQELSPQDIIDDINDDTLNPVKKKLKVHPSFPMDSILIHPTE